MEKIYKIYKYYKILTRYTIQEIGNSVFVLNIIALFTFLFNLIYGKEFFSLIDKIDNSLIEAFCILSIQILSFFGMFGLIYLIISLIIVLYFALFSNENNFINFLKTEEEEEEEEKEEEKETELGMKISDNLAKDDPTRKKIDDIFKKLEEL